jgi:DNA-binding Lrp family transcriptional regulator
MDVVDVRILRELAQANSVYPARPGLGASYRGIARTLSVSPGTVRNRVLRMAATGVLTGSSVYANPNLLGLEVGAYAVEVSPSRRKREVVDRLRGLEGVYFLQNFRGNLLGVIFAYPDARSRKRTVGAVHRITGAESGLFSRVSYPPCHVTLSGSEWKLLARLIRGPFSTYAALARELRVSPRTVKRQVAKLVHARAVLSVPTVDYRALSGCVPADLLVVYTSPSVRHEAERKILGLVGDRMVFAGVWVDFGMYSLILPKVSAATEIAEEVSRLPGVGTSRVEIVEEHIDQVHVLWKYVDRQLAPLSNSRGRPAAVVTNSMVAARSGGTRSSRGPP